MVTFAKFLVSLTIEHFMLETETCVRSLLSNSLQCCSHLFAVNETYKRSQIPPTSHCRKKELQMGKVGLASIFHYIYIYIHIFRSHAILLPSHEKHQHVRWSTRLGYVCPMLRFVKYTVIICVVCLLCIECVGRNQYVWIVNDNDTKIGTSVYLGQTEYYIYLCLHVFKGSLLPLALVVFLV